MPLTIRVPSSPRPGGAFDIELSLDTLVSTQVKIQLKDEGGFLRFSVAGVDDMEHATRIVGDGSMSVQSWNYRGHPSIVVVGVAENEATEEVVYVLP
jgi:hypothetical protein